MPAIVSMLRGVNLGGHNKIKMDALRTMCASLKLGSAQTHLQSGNVVFTTDERDVRKLAKRMEDGIEKKFGFRVAVVLRTTAEMREVVERNPFSKRKDIEPSKLLVTFLGEEISLETRKQLEAIKVGPEEIKAFSRELYVYFPNGQGQSKLYAPMDRILKKTGTGRNWNSVTKLTEMAEELESEE